MTRAQFFTHGLFVCGLYERRAGIIWYRQGVFPTGMRSDTEKKALLLMNRYLSAVVYCSKSEGGVCPARKLYDTEVLRQSRVSLGWVLSDNFRVGHFRVGQLPCRTTSVSCRTTSCINLDLIWAHVRKLSKQRRSRFFKSRCN